ncbi:hypothetical protein, partial [Streptomyces roseolus]|uniref:hypothetical protein n=1 Tax=Streptomyces roseolus TaxID=67358 RepID=UPI003651FD60
GVLADEWVTHVVTEAAALGGVDFGELEDLRIAVLIDDIVAAAPDSVEIIPLADLLGIEVPNRVR